MLTDASHLPTPHPALGHWPPSRDDVVLRYLLESGARRAPDRVAVTFQTGEQWTARGAVEEAYRAAAALRAHGLRQGDVAGFCLRNGPDLLRAWWGMACLGVTVVPMNIGWRGGLLAHSLRTVAPKLVVAAPDERERIAASGGDCIVLDPEVLRNGHPTEPVLEHPIEPWEDALLQFTSGTTGPSKAARLSHNHLFLTGSWVTLDSGLGPDDTFLVDLPLFHMLSLTVATTCVAGGIGMAVRESPSLTRYWDVARETGATAAFLLSSMVPMLLGAPPSPGDRDHSIRLMAAAPLPPDADEFTGRFGITTLITGYGSSETGGPIVQPPGSKPVPGSCGRARPGWEVRLVDGHDFDVAPGDIGELVVRSPYPWCLATGYFADPDATALAWRNGWFHTGDLFRCDEDGTYFFIDRSKDTLRRRGENISSYEVEQEVLGHPDVAEAACVAVPAEAGVDDDVKVWIVPRPGAALDFLELVEFLEPRLPHYMLPRYYELIPELPKTLTHKVQKYRLRAKGNREATWDLELHGLLRNRARGLTTRP